MEFLNLSDKHLRLKNNLVGLKKLVLLPDHCPGNGYLPVGSVAVFDKEDHEFSSQLLGPDVGCGMALAKFSKPLGDIEHVNYKISAALRKTKDELGSLGSGNHFINIYQVENPGTFDIKAGDHVAMVHSGSRLAGQEVFKQGLKGQAYLAAYDGLIDFAYKNRRKLLETVQECANTPLTLVWDKPHNTIESLDDKVIYRKGAIKMVPGETAVLTSAMARDALLLKGRPSLSRLEYSMCHGTGRKMSRRDAKELAFDSGRVREKIHIPSTIPDWYFRDQAPECYRDFNEVMPRISKYVSTVGKLKPLSFTC